MKVYPYSNDRLQQGCRAYYVVVSSNLEGSERHIAEHAEELKQPAGIEDRQSFDSDLAQLLSNLEKHEGPKTSSSEEQNFLDMRGTDVAQQNDNP